MSFLNKSREDSPSDYIKPFVRPSKVFFIPDYIEHHPEQTLPNIKDKSSFPSLQETSLFQNRDKNLNKVKKINWKKQTKLNKIEWGKSLLPKKEVEIDHNTFQCPYFDDHKLKLTRDVCGKNDSKIFTHLNKCRNYAENHTNPKIFKKFDAILVCPYSRYHHIEKSLFKEHLKDCIGFRTYCLTKEENKYEM